MLFRRTVSQAGQGLRRNLTMTIASIVTVGIALFLLAGALVAHGGTTKLKANLLNQLNVSVYLKNDITQSEQATVYADLKALPQVEGDPRYVSQAEAWALFKQYYGANSTLVREASESDIPASFVVDLYNPEQFEVVNSAVGRLPGVDLVANASQVLHKVFVETHKVTLAVVLLALLALVATVLLIYNAMQVSAFSRRRETGIMRLVGASDLSIQLPFVLEGTIIGLVGAIFALGLLFVVGPIWIARGLAVGIFAPYGQMSLYLGTIPKILGLGVVLSAFMSFVTLQRHLRV